MKYTRPLEHPAGGEIEQRYFAVPDPLDATKVSFWYLPKRGSKKDKLQPWPPRENKWGVLWHKDIPEEIRKDEPARQAYALAYFDTVKAARKTIEALICANPDRAAARFSRLAICCCCCGRTLREERSKTYGIGPECRHGASTELLAYLMEHVKVAYAEDPLSECD
jgi:hypothetical protein